MIQRARRLRAAGRRSLASLSMFAVAATAAVVAGAPPVAARAVDCTANPIPCENQQPGTSPSVWDISGSGDPSIQGFATDISVNVGGTISFKVSTGSTNYSLTIYRMGYYQGNGARQIAVVRPSASLPQHQPACLTDSATGLVDCGNWAVSASWTVPTTAVSGIYFAKLVDAATGAASHITFVVRNDSGTSDILFRTDDTTWEAYNAYGGNNLYYGTAPSSDGRAYKVSYNRPFATRGQASGYGPTNFVFYAEYPTVRWLEANGYNVSYTSSVDAERSPGLLLNHRVFMTAGHDEYWTAGERAAVTAARDAGVNMVFLTGNEVFWKTRWENSIDGSGTPYRTLVSYKETKSATPLDPADPPTWTGTWRDPRFSPPADGGRPENALNGTIFMVNRGSTDITVPAAYGKLRIWRGTAAASLAPGQSLDIGAQTVGYEWDEDVDNGFRPAGLFDVSSTTASVPELLQDYGNTYTTGTATHHLTLYRAASGALVFGAGTVQYAWALDTEHDTADDVGPATTSPDLQQATVNLLADMHAQPATLQAGLVAASASTDVTPPSSRVTAPAAGASYTSGSPVTISGTAADSGGGVVAGVEVSADGGATWHAAAGTSTWTYTWTAGAPGTITLESRAVDDSGNLESPTGGAVITVTPRTCPCTLFPSGSTPQTVNSNDAEPLELGVKFSSDTAGYVNGVSFYKSTANTGTHTGSLWTAAGALLATGTFTGETASGWQTLLFATPVAIQAATTYVASYHTSVGDYSADAGAFTKQLDVWPLHAPAGSNGVFATGAGGVFPSQTYNSTNYWVDVIVNTQYVDPVHPSVTTVSPVPGSTGAPFNSPILANFNKAVVASSIAMSLTDPGSHSVAGSIGYNATTDTASFTPAAPLAQKTTYTATVSAATDTSGNVMTAPYSWSFTTLSCPCGLWPSSPTPAIPAVSDPNPVELGVKFTVDTPGYINGVRFYKGSTNTGAHVGHLWSSTGTLLASATFTGETASGWQQVLFPSPVAVSTGSTYVASYHTNAGDYAANGSYFTSPLDVSPLHAPSSAAAGGNGVYAYGGAQFPTQSYNATNYWVDVVYNEQFQDTVAPSLAAQSPAPGATGAAWTTAVAATFTKPVQASTINFTLTAPGGAAVPASLSYNATNYVATLTPSTQLAAGATYTAAVSGATDSSGNVMAPVSWSFTTQSCPCSVWPGTATPATVSVSDASAIEVGVKFRSDTDGYVYGVRFYKGSNNTGAHVGDLWSSTGTLLASATFTGETASGWQQVLFSSPVKITANTTYVASYHTTTGFYSADGAYFATSGATNWPLHALATGVDGANGVYVYGASAFPTQSFNASNYWVDVVFNFT